MCLRAFRILVTVLSKEATTLSTTAPAPATTRTALIIEDDADTRLLIESLLRSSGFTVSSTGSGAEGLQLARDRTPDLVLLDLGLPDLHGTEVCRALRTFTDTYIVIVSGRGHETDRLLGLEMGADDYVVKPFSPRELQARIAAMFRRPRRIGAPSDGHPATTHALHVGELTIDMESREVRVAGEPVQLTRIEFELLAVLASRSRRVWERDTLVRLVWKTDWMGDTHTVDTHIANLRRKLAARRPGRWIQAVRGVGYRLVTPPS